MTNPLEVAILRELCISSMPATIEAISRAIGEQPDNIVTTLEDMASRGLVALEKGGCRSLLTASEFCAAEVRELVSQLYGGDAVAFLSDYIDAADPKVRMALESAIIKRDRQL